ncbi:MAG: flagellar motor protein MotB, partial [Plesiomonas shigelloides]
TFADLMSLLMCFFVLLLSFSEMDVMKFKQIAGSMKYAFGVQNQVELKDIPKGTSVIALEFRPGRPEPTPIDTINQQTNEMTDPMLDYRPGESDSAGGASGTQNGGVSLQTATVTQSQLNEQAKKIAEMLNEQIEDGAVEVESLGQQIIIRIREKGAFGSGSGFLQPKFRPIIGAVGELLKDVPGIVTVSGFTDDLQINNELYSSNWDLSARRAVSVAHELLKVKGFESSRMKVVGMGANGPLVPNDSVANRAKNRRVEIAIEQGKPKASDEITVVPPTP